MRGRRGHHLGAPVSEPLSTVLFPKRWVQLLGAALIGVAVILPWVVIGLRAWSVKPVGPQALGELRPEMVVVPGGKFQMGSPKEETGHDNDEQLHEVSVSSFAISRTEVTQGEFAAVMGTRPFERSECSPAGIGADLPALCVTWEEAVEYCNRLSAMENLTPAYAIEGGEVRWNREADGYRLPTEAEWEYGARAGTTAPYLTGSTEEDLARGAWYSANSNRRTHPVGQREPNPWGLYDVLGNVWEWVWDRYGDYETSPRRDPRGPDGGVDRVIRGGSWYDDPLNARVAHRHWVEPSSRGRSLGFRLARSLHSGD